MLAIDEERRHPDVVDFGGPVEGGRDLDGLQVGVLISPSASRRSSPVDAKLTACVRSVIPSGESASGLPAVWYDYHSHDGRGRAQVRTSTCVCTPIPDPPDGGPGPGDGPGGGQGGQGGGNDGAHGDDTGAGDHSGHDNGVGW